MDKESWSKDLSPTACFTQPDSARVSHGDAGRGEGCTRGSAVAGWGGEGYTGTHPAPVPDPRISHILALRPYPRPNEGESSIFDEVS